jgi:hypothetical protein
LWLFWENQNTPWHSIVFRKIHKSRRFPNSWSVCGILEYFASLDFGLIIRGSIIIRSTIIISGSSIISSSNISSNISSIISNISSIISISNRYIYIYIYIYNHGFWHFCKKKHLFPDFCAYCAT